MKRHFSQYLRSCALALVLVVFLLWLSSFSVDSNADILLAPGLILGAVAIPQGVHSNWGDVYIFLAMLIDILLYGGLVMLVWRGIARLRSAKR